MPHRFRFYGSVLLGKAGGFRSNLGIRIRQQRSQNSGNHNISHKGQNTLGKYLVCRLRINQNVKYRRKYDPRKCIRNNLNHVEQNDALSGKSAFLNRILRSEQADDDAEQSIREYPAPPHASIEKRIAQCVSDNSDGASYDRTEYRREKGQYRYSGLQRRVGYDHERRGALPRL